MNKILAILSVFFVVGVAHSQNMPPQNCNETTVPNRGAVCWNKVPSYIKYRPSMPECKGKAAAILSGPFLNIFSVVLRDRGNADRLPACKSSGNYGGCSASQCEAGLSRCSAAKVQKVVRKGAGKNARAIHCFREPGTSKIFKYVTRMTIKRTMSSDSLYRVQLKGLSPLKSLN